MTTITYYSSVSDVTAEIFKRNRAVSINAPNPEVTFHITDHGSDWLWAAFSLFVLFTIVHIFLYAFTDAKKFGLRKTLLIIPLFTNAILAFAYYTYASNLGYTWIHAEFHHIGTGNRQIFYCKFIGWFLAWPLVLTIFQIVTKASFSRSHAQSHVTQGHNLYKRCFSSFESWFARILAIEIFVLGLLIGALIQSSYKWGYFGFSVVFQLFVMFLVAKDIFTSFRASTHSTFGNLIIISFYVVWILYPICWALSEGGNVIQPDSEAVFYGILDLITFGALPIALTWLAIKNVDEEFFTKLWYPHRAGSDNSIEAPQLNDSLPDAEKAVGETARHSGDTAVAPAGVPERTSVDAERAERKAVDSADKAAESAAKAADDAAAAATTRT